MPRAMTLYVLSSRSGVAVEGVASSVIPAFATTMCRTPFSFLGAKQPEARISHVNRSVAPGSDWLRLSIFSETYLRARRD